MRTVSLLALSALAALSSAAGKTVLGKLGQAAIAAQIYAAPSPKARGLYRVEKGAYLVVRPGNGKWTPIVMRDRRLAYIPTQAVAIPTQEATGLPYEVTEDGARSAPAPRRYVASRGGGFVRGTVDSRVQMAVQAMSLEGTTPYKWGGNELGSGIDCSGFVKKMYGGIGLSLPRTAAEQATVGMPIANYQDLQPGDRLYFWDAKKGKIGHTGLYVGGGYFTHSSSGHHGIARDFLSERWRRICVAARR